MIIAVPLALALALVGCAAGPTLPKDIEAAQALERGGERDAEALAAWRVIRDDRCTKLRAAKGINLQHPDRIDPKDDCGTAAARTAQLLEKMGREREAADAWESAAGAAASGRSAARALASAASLRAGPLGEPERAAADAWRCVEDHADELPADACLAIAVRLGRGGDARALVARLDALAERHRRSDLVDNLRFAAADVAANELGDAEGAVRRWDALAASYRRSSLRDDALWRAAHLLRARGDAAGALARLRLLLATRRRALVTGSYNSEWLDDAQLLVGRIQLDDLHDPAAAAASFAHLADDFTESVLRDDALAELARAREALGDRAGACAALARLAREFPDGNQARAAAARAATLGCAP